MASSGSGSQLPAPAPGDKLHQSFSFHFPQREIGSGEALVLAAVIRQSCKGRTGYEAMVMGLDLWLRARSLPVLRETI